MIYGELQTQMAQEEENAVMKAVRQIGVNVDKGELIKALQYDRNQYAKGYEDGKNEVLDKIRAEIEHVIDNTYDSTDHDKSLYNGAYKDGLYDALDIIDKYKAESEDD